MESSLYAFKAIKTLTVASFALIAVPFVNLSVEAGEVDSKLKSISSQNNSTEIDMTPEDAEYIQKIREHYYFD